MHPRLAEAVLVLGFFTRLPVGRALSPLPSLAASAWALPLAGLVVATPGALVLWLAPGMVAAVLAVALAVWILGEPITLQVVAGAAITILGVAMIQFLKPAPPPQS